MTDYTPPLADIDFALRHIADLDELATFEEFGHADRESVTAILAEHGRFVATEVAPTNHIGDQEESHLVDGAVITPEVFKKTYRAYTEAGWSAVPFRQSLGGGGFPWVVGTALQDMLNSANMAFAMAPMLTQGAIHALEAHGDEMLQARYLERMVSGEWTSSMDLTEPDAGSDVGNVRTRAVPAADGTYRITGNKIFITFGDHDLTENIVHLVLARLPDAPAGTKGISCFVVPKFLVEDDGSLGERNDVWCVGVEHKMGIRASPTCALEFGARSDGAVGWLLGEPHAGMRTMFTMMNAARLSVGVEGLGLAERAYQQAVTHAKDRRQGRAVGAPRGERSFIIEHPDVRRMLLTMKSTIEALRALFYFDASHFDRSSHHPDADERRRSAELVELLTPMCKAWGAEVGSEVASLAIQVHGGMGYIEETGVAQHYRDARITAIYEGTNGIQALDLVGRKLGLRGGAVFGDLLARIRATCAELDEAGEELLAVATRLRDATDEIESAATWLAAQGEESINDALTGASPFLTMCCRVVGGWLLAVEALAAHRLDAAGEGDQAFDAAKVASARFFADNVLPTVSGLGPSVRSGAAGLFAVPVDQF
ncbi:MAG TPA: acyl-CoA dehydrogenase [Acidimicrobiales bacterium]|nr:acyl-CoA dehydrogenase [Acidimicrobiales bacterium]